MRQSRFALALGVFAIGISSSASLAAQSVAPVDCGPTTLTQSTSQTITPLNSAKCDDNVTHYTKQGSSWRALSLTTMGVQGAFAVCSVQFGVETATANQADGGGGTQPVTVRLYTSDPAFPGGTLTQIASTDLAVADTTASVVNTAISATVPANSQLVVEIFSPDGTALGNTFIIGSNAETETGTSYISFPDCETPDPTPTADRGYPNMHIVMNVIGQELLATPAALTVDATGAGNLNGVLEIGETATITPSWTNATENTFSLIGLVSEFTGPAGPFYIVDDGTADYGVLAAGATADCETATGDCMVVHISGARPVQHYDATLTETPTPSPISLVAGALPDQVWTLHVGGSFSDVPMDNQFYRFIETIFHKSVTGGCGGGTDYCPDLTTLRKQMAVFLLKAKLGSAYAPPDCTGTVFTDVPCTGSPFDPWIEDLSGRGITGGCAPGLYCPDDPVTRSQMAVFLLKTEESSAYLPPDCTGTVFTDVPCTGGAFDPWIEDLAGRGITGGCGGGFYCPNGSTTRGQMAVFLTKTFGLLLYGP
jgi:hypothetical protein